jgi:hypothetical protein
MDIELSPIKDLKRPQKAPKDLKKTSKEFKR